jgi:hypothetical protein
MAQDRAPVSMQLRAQVRWNMNRGCDLVVQAIGDLFRASRTGSGGPGRLHHSLEAAYENTIAGVKMETPDIFQNQLQTGRFGI